MIVLLCSLSEIVAQFIQATFPVSEDGSADPVQVCIEIVAGEVGADGLMITVERSGGSAMGEKKIVVVPYPEPPTILVLQFLY